MAREGPQARVRLERFLERRPAAMGPPRESDDQNPRRGPAALGQGLAEDPIPRRSVLGELRPQEQLFLVGVFHGPYGIRRAMKEARPGTY